MRKKEILLMLGLILVGCAVAGVRYVANPAAFTSGAVMTSISADEMVSEKKDLSAFDELKVDVSTISTYIEQGDSYSLEYHVLKKNIPEVKENNDKLSIRQPSGKGIFHINFIVSPQDGQYYKITVPKDCNILDVDLEASSGEIDIKNVNVNGKVELSSGSATIKGSTSDDLMVKASSGSIRLENITLSDLDIDIASGNVQVNTCSTDKLDLHLSSGNIDFDDIAFNEADLHISSGTVNLKVSGNDEDYSYDLDKSSGNITVDGKSVGDNYKVDKSNNKKITADLSSGNLNISFTE